MNRPKSLGQIAYEGVGFRARMWADVSPFRQKTYEKMGQAVVREVQRRRKEMAVAVAREVKRRRKAKDAHA